MQQINALFANRILNEVVNGFRVPDFEQTLGLSKLEATNLLATVHNITLTRGSNEELIGLSERDAMFFYKALECTLKELGQDEFQTRTGFDLEEGEAILKRLLLVHGSDVWES